MFKLDLENTEEPEIKFPTSTGSLNKQKSSRKTSTSALLTMPEPLTVDHNKLWKILKEMKLPDHLTYLMRNLYAGQEATVRTGHGKQTGSKSRKEYVKAVYCHPAYLTYMQSTSCQMRGWMKHKLETRLLGEISIISDTQMTPPLWHKRGTKESLDESERRKWKICLKLNRKLRSWHPVLSLHGK